MRILHSSVKSSTVANKPNSDKKKKRLTTRFSMFWVPLGIDLAHISHSSTDFYKSSDCPSCFPDFLKLSVMDAELLRVTDIQNLTDFRGMSNRIPGLLVIIQEY